MNTSSHALRRTTSADTDVLDITRDVEESGTTAGVVVVFVPGSTASVTTIEFECDVDNEPGPESCSSRSSGRESPWG